MHTEITDVVGFKQWGGPDRPGSVTESDASQGIRINGIRKPASRRRTGPRLVAAGRKAKAITGQQGR
jgi:hypothetical protein